MDNLTADPAIENLKKIVECLEQAQNVLAEQQKSIKDLITITRFQQERIDLQGAAMRALQGMVRNLEERVKEQEGFAA